MLMPDPCTLDTFYMRKKYFDILIIFILSLPVFKVEEDDIFTIFWIRKKFKISLPLWILLGFFLGGEWGGYFSEFRSIFFQVPELNN